MTRGSKSTRLGRLRRALFVTVLCGEAITLLLLVGGAFDSIHAADLDRNDPACVELEKLVTKLRKENKLVGLAAMVMVDGKVVASAADGERKNRSGVPIELGDQWHLGSVTKSITATMIARLVESGKMKWSDSVGDYFADVPIHDDWKQVTLRQLLTHTSGAPANFSFLVMLNKRDIGAECTRDRRNAVIDVITQKAANPAGKLFVYSNLGYTIAGAMAETATGIGWEELVKREVFEPLNLTSGGFGPPKVSAEKLDQPLGHKMFLGWKVSSKDDEDNTPIIGPAGIVHMSLEDICAYAAEHLRGELGMGKLLAAETYQRLHTPELGSYACGWVKNEPTYDIPRVVYWHNGSNTMWYALVVFIPDKNMVVAVTSNDGDIPKAESAAWEVVNANANQFHTEGDAERRKNLPLNAFPKKSPFSAVRWQDDRPEVRVRNEWFQLVSLDGIAVEEIVTFCQKTYEDKWQKRFEEDLVEVLFRLGIEPKNTARMVVRPIGETETQTLDDVPMTEANRRSIRSAGSRR